MQKLDSSEQQADGQSVKERLLDTLSSLRVAVEWIDPDGQVVSWSGNELLGYAGQQLARLKHAGLVAGDRVVTLASASPEWLALDLALLHGGFVSVPMHPDTMSATCLDILREANAKLVAVGDTHQAARIFTILDELETLPKVVGLQSIAIEGDSIECWNVHDSNEVMDLPPESTSIHPAALYVRPHRTEEIREVGRDEVLCSPTSRAALFSVVDWLVKLRVFESGKRFCTTEPVSSPSTRSTLYAAFSAGATVAISGRADISTSATKHTLYRLSPDVILSHPRFLEDLHTEWAERASRAGGLPELLYDETLRTGAELTESRQRSRGSDVLARLRFAVTRRFVGKRVREQLGGRLERVILTPGALAQHVVRFYFGVGIRLIEAFGVASGAGITHINSPTEDRYGEGISALPGVRVQLSDEQQIELAGGHLPTSGDWTPSGFMGQLADGEPLVHGPMNSIIRVIGGKAVSANRIEARLTASPYVWRAMVVGDQRDFLSALIVLNVDSVSRWLREHGIISHEESELARHPLVYSLIEAVVNEVNDSLPSYETIRKLAILERDFTKELGEMTAAMELRRSVITARHQLLVDSFYREQY